VELQILKDKSCVADMQEKQLTEEEQLKDELMALAVVEQLAAAVAQTLVKELDGECNGSKN